MIWYEKSRAYVIYCILLFYTVFIYIKPVFALPLRRQIIATDGVSGLFRGLSLNIVGVFPTRYLNRIQLCIVLNHTIHCCGPEHCPAGSIAQSPTTLEISAISQLLRAIWPPEILSSN